MAEPFRSDLDAARARADVLEEENAELREEVVRLRHAGGDAASRDDPAMTKLAEETLERLDEMTHAIEDAAPSVSTVADAPTPPRKKPRTARPEAPHRSEVLALRAELAAAEGGARALRRAVYGAFFAGLVVGALVAAIVAASR